jgi:hypothetical protein
MSLKIAYINGKIVFSLQDFEIGSYHIEIREIPDLLDLPGYVSIGHDMGLRRTEFIRLIQEMSKTRKIPALKYLRSVTGWGLRKSKEMVDYIMTLDELPSDLNNYPKDEDDIPF